MPTQYKKKFEGGSGTPGGYRSHRMGRGMQETRHLPLNRKPENKTNYETQIFSNFDLICFCSRIISEKSNYNDCG